MKNAEEWNVFFVCGAPKSGTTWVQRIFDAHPEIVCSGEGHFVELLTNPLSETIRKYNTHMAKVTERVYGGEAYYAPFSQQDFDALCRLFLVNRMALRVQDENVSWIGDKTPRYTLFLPSLHRLFPQARFVHIVRDPRDVAVSRLHHGYRIGMEGALTPGHDHFKNLIKNAAAAWRDNIGAVKSFRVEKRAPLLEIRYEELLAEPAARFTAMYGFLSVAADPETVTAGIAETDFETMTGGRKRGEEDPKSFFRKGVAGDWKERLDDWAVDLIGKQCGALMADYGYS
ncbi:MAG: sulfotransferase family protein [Magnetospiraceae bacterium]